MRVTSPPVGATDGPTVHRSPDPSNNPAPASASNPVPARSTVPADRSSVRSTGAALVVANLLMVGGAIAFATAGVDLDGAAQSGTVAGILPDLVDRSGALATCYSLWLLGMVAFSVAAHGLRRVGPAHPASSAASALMSLGATLGAVAFVTALTVLAVVAPAGDVALASALVWLSSTADWVATILIIGLPPLLVALAGRDTWAPPWFRGFAVLAAVAAGATAVALLTGSGLTTYGFALVPVGVACSITMGALLWRRA